MHGDTSGEYPPIKLQNEDAVDATTLSLFEAFDSFAHLTSPAAPGELTRELAATRTVCCAFPARHTSSGSACHEWGVPMVPWQRDLVLLPHSLLLLPGRSKLLPYHPLPPIYPPLPLIPMAWLLWRGR